MPTCGDLNAVQAISVPGMAGPRFDIFCQPELSSVLKCKRYTGSIPQDLTLNAEFLNGVIRQLAINPHLHVRPLHQVADRKP